MIVEFNRAGGISLTGPCGVDAFTLHETAMRAVFLFNRAMRAGSDSVNPTICGLHSQGSRMSKCDAFLLASVLFDASARGLAEQADKHEKEQAHACVSKYAALMVDIGGEG